MPTEKANWQNEDQKVSKYRTDIDIVVRASKSTIPPLLIKDVVESTVNYMMSKTKVITHCAIEKNVYRAGETIRVKIICDNKCSNSVKSFKVKLKRKSYLTGKLKSTVYPHHESEYVIEKKVDGCKPNEQAERLIEIEIPTEI